MTRQNSPRFGYVEDAAPLVAKEETTHHVGALLGDARRERPETLDWTFLLDKILDQVPTNSCVGHAASSALTLSTRARGAPVPRPSPRWIYDVARMIDGGRLHDFGTRFSSAISGMKRFGVCAESRYALLDTPINEEPPLDVIMNAGDALITGHYRIPPGPGSAELMRRAIADGFMPMFGTPVDASFDAFTSGVWPGAYGLELGRHALCLAGYRPGAFLAVNSWGKSWGEGGLAWVSESWMESYSVTDRIVITALPRSVT